MTMTQSVDPLRAATAERLERMFRLAEAHADEHADVAMAIEAIDQVGRATAGVSFLSNLLARLADCANTGDAVALTHEERVALYVASKALKGKQQP